MNVQDDVISFVAEYIGVDASNITLDTTINNDLGLDGDEGSDFLTEFSERFAVDLKPINHIYFGSEGFGLGILVWPILALLNILGWRQKMIQHVSPLTIRTVVSSARAHRWIHEEFR